MERGWCLSRDEIDFFTSSPNRDITQPLVLECSRKVIFKKQKCFKKNRDFRIFTLYVLKCKYIICKQLCHFIYLYHTVDVFKHLRFQPKVSQKGKTGLLQCTLHIHTGLSTLVPGSSFFTYTDIVPFRLISLLWQYMVHNQVNIRFAGVDVTLMNCSIYYLFRVCFPL